MEDYAYSSKCAAQFELAEVSGIIRNWLWVNCVPLRLLDPLTVKKFATANAFAAKVHMIAKARELGFSTPVELLESGSKFKYPIESPFNAERITKDVAGPGADMADAFHIARMTAMEVQVRRGQLGLDNLMAYERGEFLKVTKCQPTNVLSRPYVVNQSVGDWVNGSRVEQG
jgi:hypothetical protein